MTYVPTTPEGRGTFELHQRRTQAELEIELAKRAIANNVLLIQEIDSIIRSRET